MADSHSVASKSTYMSAEEQDDRRRQIREIMKDPNLSQTEKSKTIQSLMDGRRRNSSGTHSICSSTNDDGTASASNYVSQMANAAAAAADYYSSDEEGDAIMAQVFEEHQRPENVYGYEHYGYGDERSVSSEITHTSHYSATSYRTANNNYPIHNNLLPPGASYRQVHGRSFSLQDWNDTDRVIAAAAGGGIFANNPAQVSRLMEQSRPPCTHYERNCTIVSPCCGLAFGCRICHDDCPVLPRPIMLRRASQQHLYHPPPVTTRTDAAGGAASAVGGGRKAKATERRRSMPTDLMMNDDEENHHPIDRFAIREVICRECYTRQSSKCNKCIQCGVQFGEYHCIICNLWMSKKEQPYHCEDCGFCRVGGRDNFRHCDDCGMCIDAILFDDHNCKSGKYMSNCPICQEDLFSSRHASHEMPCGHAIHWHCFKELTSYDTRCPVCKKTAETPEQMAATWSAISMGISLQPVPPDMARCVSIYCNDCEDHQTNRRWHFLGVRCNNCLSFNTSVEHILLHGREAADFLDRLEASQAMPDGIPASIVATTTGNDDVTMDDAPSTQETSGSSLDEHHQFMQDS